MKNFNWKRYGIYHSKWQIGVIVTIPLLYLFVEYFGMPLWLSNICFNIIGAMIFYPIDKWIFNTFGKSKAEEKDYNLVYHFNPYNKKWYCMTRDGYNNYWSKQNINKWKLPTSKNWASGKDTEEAKENLLKKVFRED